MSVGEDYHGLDIRPVINAWATLTKLGGSLMPPPVLEAMTEAASMFVDMIELQQKVGARLAELTGNEAGYVSSGAAAGITLTVAACIAGTDPALIDAFPQLVGVERCEVIIHRSQRNGYDYAARQTGATVVEIEGTDESLEGALSERTACVLWFAGAHFVKDALPIERVVEIAHRRGVPVLVDAAAQIPPMATLSRFTRGAGADAVIVSGGKGLRGPQSSGVVLGRRQIIEGCLANGSPNHSIGRPMKVGKEEMLGLLAAVEWSLEQDEAAVVAGYESSVDRWVTGLSGIPGVVPERIFPSEAGQPHARTLVHLRPPCPWSRDALADALWAGDPRIAVARLEEDAIGLNPQTLQPGQDAIVLDALRRLLRDRPPTTT
ncbi:MAG TPA: aminotransferase class V-fold PLP-dependent enzyme [Candidatus Dormibacteraeota bacterium]|jgi:L-seryl-tRNA(Ser) seleniumtransferase|nr:aminotransferase class V-fold PLP-dependent enzyme [Candidatus Dormibacteraeota bacterium]